MRVGMSVEGRKIREIRKRLGLTQAAFANLLETTQGTVSRWESGDQIPETHFLVKIGKLGGSDLIGGGLGELRSRSSDLIGGFAEGPDIFAKPNWGKPVPVVGEIHWGYWSDKIEWDQQDQFFIQIPTVPDWPAIEIAGFVVKDDSADNLYPQGSVVFAAVIPGTVWPPSPPDLQSSAYKPELITPNHDDLVIVQRKDRERLVEHTIRQFYVSSEGETYLTSVASNPKYTSWSPSRAKAVSEPRIIGVIVASFRVDNRLRRPTP
jgi:transcriptional regulator with XRE-family HTH domain